MGLNREDALVILLEDMRARKTSITSYKRVLQACEALDLTDGELVAVLWKLAYADSDGVIYPYYLKAIDKGAK